MDAGDGLPRGMRESTRASSRRASSSTPAGMARPADACATRSRRVLPVVPDALLREVGTLCSEHGALVHTTRREPRGARARPPREGRSDVAHLERMASPDRARPRALRAPHACRNARMRSSARAPPTALGQPQARVRRGRVPEMLAAGIEVGSAPMARPANNDLDASGARLASLLAKGRLARGVAGARRDRAPHDPRRARPRARPRDRQPRAGKRADLVVVGVERPHAAPRWTRLDDRYASVAADVRHVVCDGRVLLRDGRHETVDAERASALAPAAARRLARRAGI